MTISGSSKVDVSAGTSGGVGTVSRPALWSVAETPSVWGAWPWWGKLLLGVILLALAFAVDRPLAVWAKQQMWFPDLMDRAIKSSDMGREFMLLEQYGQWMASVIIIAAVALLDRQGRAKALAIGLGCVSTVIVCYLLKDMLGRCRPDVMVSPLCDWEFFGPAKGFTGGAKYSSFPSAHTTGAFALSIGLAWFYPRGRVLFFTLALITAGQRVMHHAHYLSDVIAGIIVATVMTRLTLRWNWAGRLINLAPLWAQEWWLGVHRK